ncbi:MAG: CAP domain-containing protein [Nanoarchaeota archaeon]|nr:CAP domain-containing protein [Nanoarchaeota archaeon]
MKKSYLTKNLRNKNKINVILASAIAVLLIAIIVTILNQDTNKLTGKSSLDSQNKSSQDDFIRKVEQSLHYHANIIRKSQGIPQLEFDNKLAEIARAHSKDMAENNYLAHENRVGEGATERAKKAGYNITKTFSGGRQSNYIQENAGVTYIYKSKSEENGTTIYNWKTPDEIGKEMVDALLASPSHRNHLLEKDATKEGVGAAIDKENLLYFTQMFW